MRNSRDETLPGWTYDNAEFFALEREHLLLSSWVLAGHRSDLKAPGDFLRSRAAASAAWSCSPRTAGLTASSTPAGTAPCPGQRRERLLRTCDPLSLSRLVL